MSESGLIANVLTDEHMEQLIEICAFELKYFLCETVPKYQTYNNIHKKYAHVDSVFNLLKIAELEYERAYGHKRMIDAFWFNLVKQESDYGWHKHQSTTAVYYLLNTEGNGTVLQTGITIPSVDNSLYFLSKMVEHKTPSWKGSDRISIAMEFND